MFCVTIMHYFTDVNDMMLAENKYALCRRIFAENKMQSSVM